MNATPVPRRDLNGRPVPATRWSRLRARLSGGSTPPPLDVDEDDLVVVVESADEAQASSAALASTAWRHDEEAVLRHVLAVPPPAVDEVSATAALDGYVCRPVPDDVAPGGEPGGDLTAIALSRVQLIDAMHLSQERSRMASLGSRCGGRVLGWQVLQRRADD